MTQAREHHLPEMPTTGSDWRPMPPRIFEQQFAEQFEQALAKVIADMRFLHKVPAAVPDELSLRDVFAASALIAIGPSATSPAANLSHAYISSIAYGIADAMLVQRTK